MVDVSIIIVSYNTKKYTLDCIKSVQNEGSSLKKEIIVIDNGSSDGSCEAIRNLQLSITNFQLIRNKKNLGFAKANNQGIKKAKGRYILLLNSDTQVERNSVKKLIAFAESKGDAGVVGARLLNSDGSIQGSVFRFPTIFRALRQYWLGEKRILDKYYPKGDKYAAVESVVMAAFLITPLAMKKVGMLNEKFFMYFEDLDYCKRANGVGLKVYYLPSALVYHYHGASGKGRKKLQRERLIRSSKIYHGLVKHYLINLIIWSGEKWKVFRK
jgi:GT2 family glycosyltransferase